MHELDTCVLKVNTKIQGGVSLCEPYQNSNIFFLVGPGTNSELPSNRLCIWDDLKKEIAASVQFAQPIVDLKVRGDWIVVAQDTKTMVFNFTMGFSCEDDVFVEIPTETLTNNLAVHLSGEELLVAVPDQKGATRLVTVTADTSKDARS